VGHVDLFDYLQQLRPIKGKMPVSKDEYNKALCGILSFFTHHYPLRCSTIADVPCSIMKPLTDSPIRSHTMHLDDLTWIFSIRNSKNKTRMIAREVPRVIYDILEYYIAYLRPKSSSENLFLMFDGKSLEGSSLGLSTFVTRGHEKYWRPFAPLAYRDYSLPTEMWK
jgi:hypothetical protein